MKKRIAKKVVQPDCLLNYLSYVNHRVKDILYTENISSGKEVKLGEGLMLNIHSLAITNYEDNRCSHAFFKY